MKKQGIYQTDLGIGTGWIQFGSKNGEPFSQLSFQPVIFHHNLLFLMFLVLDFIRS